MIADNFYTSLKDFLLEVNSVNEEVIGTEFRRAIRTREYRRLQKRSGIGKTKMVLGGKITTHNGQYINHMQTHFVITNSASKFIYQRLNVSRYLAA